jgi:hypothetical protein
LQPHLKRRIGADSLKSSLIRWIGACILMKMMSKKKMESKRLSIKIRKMLILAIGERALIKSTEKLKTILKLLSKVGLIRRIRRK